jgi:uncharacterized protein YdeI (BOF family)
MATGTVAATASAHDTNEVSVTGDERKGAAGCYVGPSTLGITVTTDEGNPVAGEQVTVINKKTGDEVFAGTTDNAGQINVTLPQGEYDVIVQDQQKKVKLDENEDIGFTVKSPDLPKT